MINNSERVSSVSFSEEISPTLPPDFPPSLIPGFLTRQYLRVRAPELSCLHLPLQRCQPVSQLLQSIQVLHAEERWLHQTQCS